jgi:hypothetical protein
MRCAHLWGELCEVSVLHSFLSTFCRLLHAFNDDWHEKMADHREYRSSSCQLSSLVEGQDGTWLHVSTSSDLNPWGKGTKCRRIGIWSLWKEGL